MQNEGGRTKIELTGIAATEKSLRMITGITSWTRYLLLFTVSAFLLHGTRLFLSCLTVYQSAAGPPVFAC